MHNHFLCRSLQAASVSLFVTKSGNAKFYYKNRCIPCLRSIKTARGHAHQFHIAWIWLFFFAEELSRPLREFSVYSDAYVPRPFVRCRAQFKAHINTCRVLPLYSNHIDQRARMHIYIYTYNYMGAKIAYRVYIYKVIKMIHFEIATSPEP